MILTSSRFSVSFWQDMDPSPTGGNRFSGSQEMEILEIVDIDSSPISTPVPTLTIGEVLDRLPKLKQGKAN